MQTPLVSIIIPTFNRAHLIGETLDSVLAQTYTNWECIVVDDGSTDTTDELLEEYCKKDTRFQYHHRPANKPKGANSCRNYGFELSKGEYVNWFDDDDLMLEDFIKIKIEKIQEFETDFVFSKSMNFNKIKMQPMFDYQNKGKTISIYNFVTSSISWCTLDFLASFDTLEKVLFNENLLSGQEFNFFSKYLCLTTNGAFIDEILALRRVHENSIQGKQQKRSLRYRREKYLIYLLTYQDIMICANKITRNHLLDLSMSKAFDMASNKEKIPLLLKLIKFVYKEKNIFLTIIYLSSLIFSYIFKKGYSLMNFSRNYQS